jgi:hypothetical protein
VGRGAVPPVPDARLPVLYRELDAIDYALTIIFILLDVGGGCSGERSLAASAA